jgi:ABC-2 type transport system ATP-binding protein
MAAILATQRPAPEGNATATATGHRRPGASGSEGKRLANWGIQLQDDIAGLAADDIRQLLDVRRSPAAGHLDLEHEKKVPLTRATLSVTMPRMPRVSLDMPAIEVSDLRKRYGQVDALAGLSMTVGRGEVFGFLGPNGAGKTTTVKLLLGLARPTAGGGKVLGAPLGDLASRRKIGYLPELFRYQPWLKAREVLTLHGELMGLPRGRRRPAADEALRIVGLDDRASDVVGKFSKGMQQRLGLATALLGEPALVILDEPTSALDPVGRVDVRAIVRAAADRGAAVFLNSHLLSEVEQVCDRVAILDHGRVVASGDLDDVLGVAETQVRVTGVSASDLPAIERFGPPTLEGDVLAIRPMDPAGVPDLVATLVSMGAKIHEVRSGRRTLEQRFLDLVARDRPPAGTPSALRLR